MEHAVLKPGIYDMPAHIYHADPCPTPSLNAGLITTLLDQTPAHAFAEHPRLDGSKIFKPTEASDNGSVAHSLLFEGISNMVECQFDDWRKKEARTQRDAIRAEGKVPALTHQINIVRGMANSGRRIWTRNQDLAAYPPEAGVGEQSLFWTEHDEFGNEYWMRCRPDWLSDDRLITIDGKFTDTSVRPDLFAKQMMRMDYHTRAAFYIRGIKKVFGTNARYAFLSVESSAPHEGVVLELDPMFISLGEERVEEALALWMKCMREKKWPGYGDRIQVVAAPAWALSDELIFDDEPELETQS